MPTYRAQVTFRVRDEKGQERNVTSHAELTYTSAADLEALIQDMVSDFDAPLGGRTVGAFITIEINVSGQVKASPQPGSFVGDGATISFMDSEGNANPVHFPTMASSKYTGGVLNTADSEVDALIDLWLPSNNVSGSASLDMTDEDNRKYQEVVSGTQKVIKGFRSTRKFRGKA